MHYRITAKTKLSGKGILRAWYAGRKTGGPRFEVDIMHQDILRYYYFENAEEDKIFLEGLPKLYFDVEIVAFKENGQILDENVPDQPGASTVELDHVSVLDIMNDVQQILTQIVVPGKHANTSPDKTRAQARTALNLVLKAITIMKEEDKEKATD